MFHSWFVLGTTPSCITYHKNNEPLKYLIQSQIKESSQFVRFVEIILVTKSSKYSRSEPIKTLI
jgi:hypothetical protein